MILELKKEEATKILNLNPLGFVDQTISDRQFEVIVDAFNHLNNGNTHIYIADEVGLGKTYIAIGITSLLRHFSSNSVSFNDIIIVPKKNLQIKWQKEIRNFINHNYLINDNRVKSVIGLPIGLLGNDQMHDKFQPFNYKNSSYNSFRMSSFSMGTHENFDWKVEFQRFPERSIVLEKFQDTWDNSFNRRLYAILMNINTPDVDCLIVDEVHNFKKGLEGNISQRNEVMIRYMGNIMEEDHEIFIAFPSLKAKIKPLAKKIIFLSATPIDKGLYQLKNQLDIFLPNHKYRDLLIDDIDEKMEPELSEFLIRGVMNIRLKEKDYSRNMYRHEHRKGNVKLEENAEPIKLTDDRLALITGLVQYKTMKELSAKNNPSFEIGLLAGFESFKPKPKSQELEFDSSVQSEQKEAADANVIQNLAESYHQVFGKSMPHLKQDALVKELFELMIKGEKALVFTRRVASVNELEAKLSEEFSDYLFRKIETFEKLNKNSRLQVLTKTFNEQSQRKEIEESLELVSQRININKFNQLFSPQKEYKTHSEILQLLTLLYDEPSEDEYWVLHKVELLKFQELIRKHIGRTSRVSKELIELSKNLLMNTLNHIISDTDPDNTLEKEYQGIDEVVETPYFFQGFFKGKGKSFRKATYDNPWYELNLYLLNSHYKIFDIDYEKWKKFNPIYEKQKLSFRFKNEQDNYESVLRDKPFNKYSFNRDLLKSATFMTSLLLETCHNEFNKWVLKKRELSREKFSESINSLVEIIKGIFRSGSGIIPAYLAWSTNDFTVSLNKLLESDFQFVLEEIKLVIKDFERIVSCNFPESSKIKYTLYNQLPVQGVSGQHKINVSKIASQFRMPGFPYILVATDILKEGEDLHTYCTNVYHYGIAWNPSDMEQRTGRIDRIGSKCYHGLIAQQEDTIPFKRKLQVLFPYLSDTLEVNQVARVFHAMNKFVDTFYKFTDVKTSDNRVGIGELVKEIPPQIITKLESKYDISHFNKITNPTSYLKIQPKIGLSNKGIEGKLDSFNEYIKEVHVDRVDEYSRLNRTTLRINGLIYNEEKNRQCPFRINVINSDMPGEFQYELVSSITKRGNLTRGAMNDIREKFTGKFLFEVNDVIFIRSFASINNEHSDNLRALEKLVFQADDLEEKYAKEDINYMGA